MSRKTRRYGTQNDKLQASKALRYEWWMLNECAARIPSFGNKDTIMCNALIEAFCVHLRNFIEFFHLKQEKLSDQLFWKHYLSTDEKINLKNDLFPYKKNTNKLLSHLTYERINYTEETKSWPTGQIANEINENMFQFIDAADQSLLCDKIKKYKKQLESVNKAYDDAFTCSSSDDICPNMNYTITKNATGR